MIAFAGWLRACVSLGVLVGTGWLVFYGYTTLELRRAIAETNANDSGWRLAEIEAIRAKIPDVENAALVIEAGYKLIPKDSIWFDRQKCLEELSRDPSRKLTGEQLAAIREVISTQSAAMAEYRKLTNLPRGRFTLTVGPNPISSLPGNIVQTRRAVEALRYDMYERLESNDVLGATDRLLACLNVGRAIGDEPFLISMLVRVAGDAITLTAMERFLGQCEADPASLSRLQAELEKIEADPILFWAVRGERGWGFAVFEFVKANPSQATDSLTDSNVWLRFLAYVPGTLSHQQAALLRHMNRMVDISRSPPETWKEKLAAVERDTSKLPTMAASAASSVVKVAAAAQRHRTNLRCMIVAIAADRYHAKHSKWPTSLDDLVTEKILTKVPVDPYDGKSLRWKRTADGAIVYSVGDNCIDDGGALDRDKMPFERADIGFELFDPAKRRQPPPG